MRLSETSSWPSRASSKAGAAGTVATATPAPPTRRAQLARQLRRLRPGERDHDVGLAAPADQVVEPLVVARVDLEHAALAGVGRLPDELEQPGVEAGGHEDGAAAGERPQRGCGRQRGGGADVDEREAHGAPEALPLTERRATPNPMCPPAAAGLGRR